MGDEFPQVFGGVVGVVLVDAGEHRRAPGVLDLAEGVAPGGAAGFGVQGDGGGDPEVGGDLGGDDGVEVLVEAEGGGAGADRLGDGQFRAEPQGFPVGGQRGVEAVGEGVAVLVVDGGGGQGGAQQRRGGVEVAVDEPGEQDVAGGVDVLGGGVGGRGPRVGGGAAPDDGSGGGSDEGDGVAVDAHVPDEGVGVAGSGHDQCPVVDAVDHPPAPPVCPARVSRRPGRRKYRGRSGRGATGFRGVPEWSPGSGCGYPVRAWPGGVLPPGQAGGGRGAAQCWGGVVGTSRRSGPV